MVERLTVNQMVVGSIPTLPANLGEVAERLIATVLKTVECKSSVSSNLTFTAILAVMTKLVDVSALEADVIMT